MKLQLLSYNVHKCIGGLDRRYDVARVAAVIAEQAPDIVLLQEVAQNGKLHQGQRQVDLLGTLLGYQHHSYFVNVRFGAGRGEYGNAILSRWPIVSTENVDLTIAGKKARSVLHGEVRLSFPDGHSRTLHVFNLHLGLSEKERREQLRRFLECGPLRRLQHRTPVVVAGDFNDVWGTLGRRLLVPAGFEGMPRALRTFPAWAPIRALDSLYVGGDLDLRSVSAVRSALARRASDHLPLMAEVQLRA